MIKKTVVAFILSLFVACGATSDFAGFNDSNADTGNDNSATEMDTDTAPEDTSPDYWSIAGTWAQFDGQPQSDSISLDLYFWTESLDLLCTFTIGATSVSDL